MKCPIAVGDLSRDHLEVVTDAQVRLLRRKLMENKTLECASAEAGMCERTGRRWQSGPLPSETKSERSWRTRKDPFEAVWDLEIVPLLEADRERATKEPARHQPLQAKTILGVLSRREPDTYHPGHLRTLQRRIRDWRALHGAEKLVQFEQEHAPGEAAAFDFTHCAELGVTIHGVAFPHLLFVFRLAFSKWTWVTLAVGETFEALVSGLQGALWDLGGVPKGVRHDNLSAATHELRRTGGRTLTRRFQEVLDHYDLKSSRITPGESHENGIAEKANHLIKSALSQEMKVRGTRDFGSRQEYIEWVRTIVDRDLNAPRATAIEEERNILQPLPSSRLPEYSTFRPVVRRWSTFRVGHRVYSVPSRLIGHEIEVRQYADEVEVRYNNRVVERFPRLRGNEDARIDYRHMIWSLVRKPGAFAHYKYREELFPTLVFRRAYDALLGWRESRSADIEYLRILHLAASTMESRVEMVLKEFLENGERFGYIEVKDRAQPASSSAPNISIPDADLKQYDRLLRKGAV